MTKETFLLPSARDTIKRMNPIKVDLIFLVSFRFQGYHIHLHIIRQATTAAPAAVPVPVAPVWILIPLWGIILAKSIVLSSPYELQRFRSNQVVPVAGSRPQ